MIAELLQKLTFLASLVVGSEPLLVEPAAGWALTEPSVVDPGTLSASIASQERSLESLGPRNAQAPTFLLKLEPAADKPEAILFAPTLFEGQYRLWISAGEEWQRLPDFGPGQERAFWFSGGRLPNLRILLPEAKTSLLLGTYIGPSERVPQLRLQTVKGFVDSQTIADSLLWLLWGACLVLATYQVLIWFSTRESIYLTYAAFGGGSVLGHMALSGELISLFPDRMANIAQVLAQLSSLSLLLVLEYAKQFLQLKQRRMGAHQLLCGFQVYVLFLFLVELRVPSARVAEIASTTLMSLVLAILALQQYRRGDKSARNMIPAMGLMCFFSLVGLISTKGNFPLLFQVSSFMSFGSLCQLVLLALALGDRVYLLEEEQIQLERQRQAEQEAHKAEVIELNKQLEQKVEEQTRDIRAMLESTKIGLMSVTEDLSVHKDYAKYLETILEEQELGGRSFFEVLLDRSELGADEKAKITTALEYSLGEDELFFEANASVFPREVKLGLTKGRKIIDLDWVPIPSEEGNTEKVLISLRDMTETLQLREEADASKRSVVLISELIELGPQRYQKFNQACGEAWPLIEAILQKESKEGFLPQDPIRRIYVTLHTIKGLVRMFKLSALTDAIHQAEEIVDKKQLLTSEEIISLREALAVAQTRHREYQEAMKPLQRIQDELTTQGLGATA